MNMTRTAHDDPSTTISSMLGEIPNLSTQKKSNGATFLVGKKVFAFTRDDSVAMKLPKERSEEVIKKRGAKPLVMGKRVMKEWIVIKHADPEEYKKDLDLFKEALTFASSA